MVGKSGWRGAKSRPVSYGNLAGYGCGSKPMGSHFGVGAPPILVNRGDWDVHWGYDLHFDPWPYLQMAYRKGGARRNWMWSIMLSQWNKRADAVTSVRLKQRAYPSSEVR